MNAQVHSRQEVFGLLGTNTLLTEKDLSRALIGFLRLRKDPPGTWECSLCGHTPEYLGIQRILFSWILFGNGMFWIQVYSLFNNCSM